MTRYSLLLSFIVVVTLMSCGGPEPTGPDPDPTPTNAAPVAAAGPDQSASASFPVLLDGSASTDADGDAITYAWSIATAPTGSAASLVDPTTATPSFTPDVAGDYIVQLVVSDATEASSPDQVTVTALDRTSSAMIDGGGGDLTSTDGGMMLEVPAGALASSVEISITEVPANQRDPALSDVGSDALVYEMGPDGLEFDTPIQVTLTPPESLGPTVDGDEYSAPMLILGTLSGGTFELAEDHQMEVDLSAMTSQAGGTIDHFSSLVSTAITDLGGARIFLEAPEVAEVDEPFQVTTGVFVRSIAGGVSFENVRLEDDSDWPLEPVGEFMADQNTHDYVCKALGEGTLLIRYVVWGIGASVGASGETDYTEDQPFRAQVAKKVECTQPFSPFEDFAASSPEGVAGFETAEQSEVPTALVVAHTGGARLTDNAGATAANLSAPALAMNPVFQADGNADDGIVTASGQGLFEYRGAVPTTASQPPPELTLTSVVQPANGPTMTARATDVVAFGEVGSRGLVATLFADQDIALFESGTDGGTEAGFVFRDDLAEVFKPGGVSIFGTDLPISAHVRPAGFDEANPMLVLTVSDDASEESKLWRVELDNGAATATTVDNIFPSDGARRIRCALNVCAISAYGAGIANGNVTRFTWDGASTFAAIAGFGGGRSIGIDVRPVGEDRVRIAETSFLNGSFRVTEVTTAGEYWDSVTLDVPEGCTGPGHVLFRLSDQLIITCNTSGNVIVVEFELPGS